ncbi:MAG TPA: type II toxin-antitoxin system VapC family toxin [Thermoanaerobaculia bacterium]|jgi:predicted nucleic acid-binding protein|nr:type II toxin-antitoxin system VapC family toxin [Thermoanaerobaculia bacterium]
MNVVVDASVIVKWVFPESEAEEHVEQALELLAGIKDGKVILLQPPHWLVEVAAVVTRLRPEFAEPALDLLDAMEFPAIEDLSVLKRASRISRDLNHHLFDTLYHAVALEYDHTLVTADDHYFRKAKHLGRMVLLKAWPKG